MRLDFCCIFVSMTFTIFSTQKASNFKEWIQFFNQLINHCSIFEDHNGKFCDNSTEIFATCSGFGCKCNLTKIKSLLPIISLFYICWNWFFYFVNYHLLPFYDKAFYKSHQFSYYGHGYFLDVLFGLFWTFIYNNSSSKEYPEHYNLSPFNAFI